MPVEINDQLKPGDLYITLEDGLYSVHSFFTCPSAKLESVFGDELVEAGARSLILEKFISIESVNREELLKIIKRLVQALAEKKEEVLKQKRLLIRQQDVIDMLEMQKNGGRDATLDT